MKKGKAMERGYQLTPADQARAALSIINAMASALGASAMFASKDSLGSQTYAESIRGIEQNLSGIGIWLDRVRSIDKVAEVLATEPDDRGAFGER